MKIKMTRFGKPFDPNKERRNKRKSFIAVVAFIICAIIVVTVLAIFFEKQILIHVAEGQEDTWIASIASYWGGIIGGVVSGVLAFLGVFYTIRYFKESDAQKERAAVQPFLLVEIWKGNQLKLPRGFTLGDIHLDINKRKEVQISIKNIGNGFANTIVIHNGNNLGGYAFKKVIPVGDSVYTFFDADLEKLPEGLPFGIQYIDSKTNEYFQEYCMRLYDGEIQIDCGYPQVIKK